MRLGQLGKPVNTYIHYDIEVFHLYRGYLFVSDDFSFNITGKGDNSYFHQRLKRHWKIWNSVSLQVFLAGHKQFLLFYVEVREFICNYIECLIQNGKKNCQVILLTYESLRSSAGDRYFTTMLFTDIYVIPTTISGIT